MSALSKKANRERRRTQSYSISRTPVEGQPGLELHDPAATCGGCKERVTESRPETRTSYKVYCSIECKMAVFEANGTQPPRPPRQQKCPRPDKFAFESEAWARWQFKPLLAVPGFNVYRCVCGFWHGGRR